MVTIFDQQYRSEPPSAAPLRTCWLCEISLPVSQMTADGDSWWADLRWYCQDIRSCTRRWVARRASQRNAKAGLETSDARAAVPSQTS